MVPMSPDDVNANWLQKELLNIPGIETVQVEGINQLSDNAGFLSAIFNAQVVINGEAKKLFIKINLPGESSLRIFVDRFDADITEINAYKKYLPMLVEAERRLVKSAELSECMPKFYNGGHKIVSTGTSRFVIS